MLIFRHNFHAVFSGVLFFITLILVFVGTIWLLNTKSSNMEYGKKMAVENIEKTSTILTDHLKLNFREVEITLKSIEDKIYFGRLFSQKHILNPFLKSLIDDSTNIVALAVTDRKGNVINFANNSDIVTKLSVFSKTQKYADNPDIIFEKLDTGFESNLLVLSKSYNNINGEFGGSLIAIIDGNHILNFFRSISQNINYEIAFFNHNNKIILKHKSVNSNIEFQNIDISTQENILENNQGFIKAKLIQKLQLKYIIFTDKQTAINNWKNENSNTVNLVTTLLIFLSIIAIFIYFLSHQMKKTSDSEKKLLRASLAKSDFIAKVSHELRTPLNAIIGFSEMLNKKYFGKLNTEQDERINDIKNCGKHLLDMINKILDFSKSEIDKSELHEETININEVIESSIKMVETIALKKNIKIINSVKDQTLKIDKRKVKQIILNLLSNSLKFTKRNGQILITSSYENNEYIISVIDNGIGMDKKDIPKAMEAFEQVHKKGDEGTGLGLPICKMFTEIHGGIFHFDSEKNQGTLAQIILPKFRVI